MIEITKFLIDTKKIIKGRNLFDKSRNYNKKGCTVEIEGVTENILKELFAVIPFITTTDLNAAEIKVVLCIARNTYGKRVTECKMSVGDIQKATNMSKRYLQEITKSLISKSILVETEKATPTTPRCIAINDCFKSEKAVR